MSDENKKPSSDDPDFEGHKLGDEQKLDQKLDRASDDTDEPDFEGHKLGGGDAQLTEKLEG